MKKFILGITSLSIIAFGGIVFTAQANNNGIENIKNILDNGAGQSVKIPVGLLNAQGIEKKKMLVRYQAEALITLNEGEEDTDNLDGAKLTIYRDIHPDTTYDELQYFFGLVATIWHGDASTVYYSITERPNNASDISGIAQSTGIQAEDWPDGGLDRDHFSAFRNVHFDIDENDDVFFSFSAGFLDSLYFTGGEPASLPTSFSISDFSIFSSGSLLLKYRYTITDYNASLTL